MGEANWQLYALHDSRWRSYRGRMYLQDTADNSAIGEHVLIILVPLA
jgi:hypothetical protein